MAKRKTYTVNGEVFKTQKALTERIRSIVAKYDDGDFVTGLDFEFAVDLFENHPDSNVKFGCGIWAMSVERNPKYPSTRGFYLHRIDGTGTDISWTECLRPTPHRKKVIRAFRVMVEPFTQSYKQKFFDMNGGISVCELTGENITYTSSHVDHVPPVTFQNLIDEFCSAHDIDLDLVKLKNENADNKYIDEIESDSLASEWIDFHNTNAKLRVVSRLGNLSHSKMQA